MTICPRLFLLTSEFRYCGEPDEAGCNLCLTQGGLKLGTDIVSWRKTGTSLIEGADRVICPSIDVGRRIGRYAETGKIIVVPHDGFYRPTSALRPVQITAGERLRVALIGGASEQKGGSYLLDCVRIARERGSPIGWHIVGDLDGSLSGTVRALGLEISTTGRYEPHELPELLGKLMPHIVFFAQRSPETYSYSLSEAYAANLPVLVPEIGPFPERAAGIGHAWTYPLSASPDELIDILEGVRDQFLRGTDEVPPTPEFEQKTLRFDPDFYRGAYLEPVRADPLSRD
jgi:glycosyltransferase involved in cell wall biosynthesis